MHMSGWARVGGGAGGGGACIWVVVRRAMHACVCTCAESVAGCLGRSTNNNSINTSNNN